MASASETKIEEVQEVNKAGTKIGKAQKRTTAVETS